MYIDLLTLGHESQSPGVESSACSDPTNLTTPTWTFLAIYTQLNKWFLRGNFSVNLKAKGHGPGCCIWCIKSESGLTGMFPVLSVSSKRRLFNLTVITMQPGFSSPSWPYFHHYPSQLLICFLWWCHSTAHYSGAAGISSPQWGPGLGVIKV